MYWACSKWTKIHLFIFWGNIFILYYIILYYIILYYIIIFVCIHIQYTWHKMRLKRKTQCYMLVFATFTHWKKMYIKYIGSLKTQPDKGFNWMKLTCIIMCYYLEASSRALRWNLRFLLFWLIFCQCGAFHKIHVSSFNSPRTVNYVLMTAMYKHKVGKKGPPGRLIQPSYKLFLVSLEPTSMTFPYSKTIA